MNQLCNGVNKETSSTEIGVRASTWRTMLLKSSKSLLTDCKMAGCLRPPQLSHIRLELQERASLSNHNLLHQRSFGRINLLSWHVNGHHFENLQPKDCSSVMHTLELVTNLATYMSIKEDSSAYSGNKLKFQSRRARQHLWRDPWR